MKKIFIANRAEIASRIARSCKKLNIKTCGVVADSDKNLPFVLDFDEFVVLEGSTAQETYLNETLILKHIKELGCDAVHPGYGFLSENFEFAQKVKDLGVVFIGPLPETIKTLGSKTESKKIAKDLGIPTAEGVPGGLSDSEILEKIKNLPFPLLIKATNGGGGRGMRVVSTLSEMPEALKNARSESKKFFNSDDIFIERLIKNGRHIEVQVFGDTKGNILHLWTRDCSIQRRNQKLLEEAPAPLPTHIEEKLLQYATKIARATQYQSAGTVEFLVKDEEVFFLEVNTRLQVEHPVTEMITGLDLVEMQIKVAQEESLPSQETIKKEGHAIEFRINSEHPTSFAISLGEIHKLRLPKCARCDFGFSQKNEITPYFDNMIGKLIVVGSTREDSINKSKVALGETVVSGVETTIPFFKWLVTQSEVFLKTPDTGFIPSLTEEQKNEIESFEYVDAHHVSGKAETLGEGAILFHEPVGSFLLVKNGIEASRSVCRKALRNP